MRRMLTYFATGIAALTIGLLVWAAYPFGSQGLRALDRWEAANATFKVRVTVYAGKEFPAPGVSYVFQSAPADSDDWQAIVAIPADQPISKRNDWFRFVSEGVGYTFLGSHYMVTTDGARTWFVWDANKEVPVEEFMQRHNLWPAVEEVEVRPDGGGRMTLYRYLSGRERGPDLRTTDYGRHWTIDR